MLDRRQTRRRYEEIRDSLLATGMGRLDERLSTTSACGVRPYRVFCWQVGPCTARQAPALAARVTSVALTVGSDLKMRHAGDQVWFEIGELHELSPLDLAGVAVVSWIVWVCAVSLHQESGRKRPRRTRR
jgi:hypothetical protein